MTYKAGVHRCNGAMDRGQKRSQQQPRSQVMCSEHYTLRIVTVTHIKGVKRLLGGTVSHTDKLQLQMMPGRNKHAKTNCVWVLQG